MLNALFLLVNQTFRKKTVPKESLIFAATPKTVMMKNVYAIATLLLAFGPAGLAVGQHAYVEQNLLDRMEDRSQNEGIPIVLMLEDVVDLEALKADMKAESLPVERRPKRVIHTLKAKADATQPEVLEFIKNSGEYFDHLRTFWITNSIALSAGTDLIEALAAHPAIAYMAYDAPVIGEVDHLRAGHGMAKSSGSSEPGLSVIGAPEMWAMGYTGQGRMALTIDTGVWPDHPALSDRFLPNIMPLYRTWFPFFSPVPTDKPSSHGTHVSGTMLGLDAANADTIGVAFGAYFIAADPTVGQGDTPTPLSLVMGAFEWSINPDGNEDTSDDVPDVINNSWGRTPSEANPACQLLVEQTFLAVEAAGIASIFSAGNAGPDPETIGVPNNTNMGLVNSFSVGALNGNSEGPEYPIANFSSRGPSLCVSDDESRNIKPEVSAPGVAVRSAVGSDGYDSFSGTSMASPHTSGAVLLLKEAFPFLSGEELLLALYHTAIDQGVPGEDNTYGMGLIHVKAAFDHLAETYDPAPPATLQTDMALVKITDPDGPLRCSGPGQSLLNPTVVVRNNGVETVTGFTFRASLNEGPYMVWEDAALTIAADEEVEVLLPFPIQPVVGHNELHIKVDALEGEFDLFNNNAVARWSQMAESDGPTLFEPFDDGLNNGIWTVLNPDNDMTWDTAWVVQKDGEMGWAAWMNFNAYNPIASQRDYLIGPSMSGVTAGETYNLSFDLFYRKRSGNSVQFDTLAVIAVVNCGGVESQTELMRSAGETLWTVDVNGANAFPENAAQWGDRSFNFTPVPADPDEPLENFSFHIVFEAVNRRGNNLLLDNINLSTASSTGTMEALPSLGLRPNPASDQIALDWSHGPSSAQVTIYDLSGKALQQVGRFDNHSFLDVSGLASGIYLVEAQFVEGMPAVGKLVIQ